MGDASSSIRRIDGGTAEGDKSVPAPILIAVEAEKWRQIKSVFDQAVEMQTSERSSLLGGADNDVRKEVEKMLAADAGDLSELSPAFRFAPDENGSKPPERINQYKIETEIGRGGMGAVYLARRDDGEFKQKVAIKLIKRGMDSDDILRRFRTERQILAELQHENIARLLDGGVTSDGLPFYVMEHIDGATIDEFCKSNDLDLAEKLNLFRKVCSAVSYAHPQLVVHRDLKPSNILVCADGTPKLLDFGIAKILDADDTSNTATAFGIMTPAYASPEQVRGEKISTVSDVYSLGVIFCELLTEERPLKIEGKSYAEILEIINQTDAPAPSSTAARGSVDRKHLQNTNLRGDLDTIALKALQKSPERRYASVEQFSEDIRRYTEGLPISARPDTTTYRIEKFIRRNKIPVAAAAFTILALCIGTAGALWQARRAEAERAVAQKRFDDVRQLANRVVFTYHDAIADLPGSTAVRQMLVTDALQYLDQLGREAAGDTNLQLELGRAYLKLGDVQGKMYNANVGDSEGALESYRKAVALFETAIISPAADSSAKDDLIRAYDNLAFLMLRTGGLEEARGLIDRALELHHVDSDSENVNPSRTLRLIDLNIRYLDMRRITPEGLAARRRLEPLVDDLLRSNPDYEVVKASARLNQRIGTDNQRLAQRAEKEGDPASKTYYEQALAHHEKSLKASEQLTALDPAKPDAQRYLTTAHGNVAESLAAVGRTDEALKMAEKFESLVKNALNADPGNQETNLALSNVHEIFANIYVSRGDLAQAIKYNLKALSIDEAIYRADAKNNEVLGRITERHKTLAELYSKQNEPTKAAFHKQKATP